MVVDKFCRNCGAEHLASQKADGYPITCLQCSHQVWKNPVPVVTIMQPVVYTNERNSSLMVGLAIAKRAIEPARDTWALLGGHVDDGEDLEEAAAREWREESALNTKRDNLHLLYSEANGKGHVLIAVDKPAISLHHWHRAELCPENSEFGVLWGTWDIPKLGFPIHQRFARRWFDEERPIRLK